MVESHPGVLLIVNLLIVVPLHQPFNVFNRALPVNLKQVDRTGRNRSHRRFEANLALAGRYAILLIRISADGDWASRASSQQVNLHIAVQFSRDLPVRYFAGERQPARFKDSGLQKHYPEGPGGNNALNQLLRILEGAGEQSRSGFQINEMSFATQFVRAAIDAVTAQRATEGPSRR